MRQTDQKTRERVLELAKRGNTVRQVADRLGLSYDLVRRQVERAEERGDLPPGTLDRLTPNAPKRGKRAEPVEQNETPAPKLAVYAPPRHIAAELGRCSCCADPTEIAVTINGTSFRLCRPCTVKLQEGVERALADAMHARRRFNQLRIR